MNRVYVGFGGFIGFEGILGFAAFRVWGEGMVMRLYVWRFVVSCTSVLLDPRPESHTP